MLRWLTLDRFRKHAIPQEDAQVTMWKRAWMRGAEAQWTGTSAARNPYARGAAEAAAWMAGWRWAEDHPDRRQPDHVRFAHPNRRSTDSSSLLKRSARAGAVGLSMLAVAGWLWRMQRRSGG